MKKLTTILGWFVLALSVSAQSPQKFSYQAVVRDTDSKLVQNHNVGMRFTVLQGSSTGTAVYTETHNTVTNVNGLVAAEIGGGATTDDFSAIDWTNGPYFLKTETDPTGGTAYSITGISQFLSVPYALYALNSGYSPPVLNKTTITTTQTWTVPPNVTKIKVELWGASGGGGGAGVYSYSYYLNDGGYGGSGGFAQDEMDVVGNQQLNIVMGTPGAAGENAHWNSYGYWEGDTDGSDGGDSWFEGIKAAGGTGGKRGSFSYLTVDGNAGTDNIGAITGYADVARDNILDVFQGLERSYIADRVLTSKPGTGGSILTAYSIIITPTAGEGGCAIITFFE